MQNSNKYIAIIGDLVNSRAMTNRNEVQNALINTLNTINSSDLKQHIAAKFVITLGDEFQGLVTRNFPLHPFLELYHSGLPANVATRFGIGLGELATELKSETIGMDGPCFHNARSAITRAKNENINLIFQGFEMNTALNALYHNINNITQNWKARQLQVISLYKDTEDQTNVAKKMKISRQAVHRILKAAKYDLVQTGWDGVQELFSFI
ncbi:MAG TPA: SatD family protein [bacterium]|nr:SatD family protein [bacterium]HPN46105.1 SatD family protein [bacterium]